MFCYDIDSNCKNCPISKCDMRLEPYSDLNFSCNGNCYECEKAIINVPNIDKEILASMKKVEGCKIYYTNQTYKLVEFYGRIGEIVKNSAAEEAIIQMYRCKACEHPFKRLNIELNKLIMDFVDCRKSVIKIAGIDLQDILEEISKINPIECCSVKKEIEEIINLRLTKDAGKTLTEICNFLKNMVKNGYFIHELTIKHIFDSMIKEGIVIQKENVYYLV